MAKSISAATYRSFKPRRPEVSKKVKSEVSCKAQQLVDQYLKPSHVEQPENPQCNYIADTYTRWDRENFFFCATYVAFFLTRIPKPLKSLLREWAIWVMESLSWLTWGRPAGGAKFTWLCQLMDASKL